MEAVLGSGSVDVEELLLERTHEAEEAHDERCSQLDARILVVVRTEDVSRLQELHGGEKVADGRRLLPLLERLVGVLGACEPRPDRPAREPSEQRHGGVLGECRKLGDPSG